MDDEYASKAKSIYSKYTSTGEAFNIFLDNSKEGIVNAGKGFVDSNEIFIKAKITGVKELTGFGREYNYLINHGYIFDINTMKMKFNR